jgi:hypothetical protein
MSNSQNNSSTAYLRFAEVQDRQKVEGTKKNYMNKVNTFCVWLIKRNRADLVSIDIPQCMEPMLPLDEPLTKEFFGFLSGESLNDLIQDDVEVDVDAGEVNENENMDVEVIETTTVIDDTKVSYI